MKFSFEYSGKISGMDYMIHVLIEPSEFDHDPIYLFDILPEGFNHMFGVISEYPDIEYVDKINESDEDFHQDGRLRIIGVDLI